MKCFPINGSHLTRAASVPLMLFATSAYAVDITTCPTDAAVPMSVAEALDGVLTAAVDTEGPLSAAFGAAPGAVLSLQAPDWTYARAAGVADPEAGQPISCDMAFQIGSNTKMMTAAVILQLQEEGALSLDDLLSVHLPEVANALPNGDVITLRQLANHTSGVFSYTDNAPDGSPGIMEGDIADPAALKRGYTMTELVEFAIDHGAPSFSPGADGQWSYSNTGFILLGLIIKRIEGQNLADVFKTRIFDPLEMDDTFFGSDVPTPEMGLPRAFLAMPFDVETTDWNMSQGAAAGAVVSTAADMHVFIQALMSDALFRVPDTFDVMQDTVPTGSPGIPAYGIGLAEKAPGVWGHGGQTLGFQSEVVEFSEQGISLVGWATSSQNIMGLGAQVVSQALVDGGVLPDPLIAAAAALRESLVDTEWRLISVADPETGEQAMQPDRYSITFVEPGDFAAQADCNRLLGGWNLDKMTLTITPGPMTKAACPPDSRSDAYVGWLGTTTSAQIDDAGHLILTSNDDGTFTLLQFESAQ
ncbi:serine hydrolase [Sulfitobacter sp. SK011]|uniref:serine hydrolase n=1 Tax=Sulfitobacter sp. SK011 TaxID=1389004 RepID=UPI0013B3A72E|nr:serine hydrolase [Sulfitobacter sp. SK011]